VRRRPDYGGCEGTLITRCDENDHVGTGDCGAFGAACSTQGGSPHCVHPVCSMNLDGAEDGTFCRDDTVLGTCALGVLSEGDCGAYGAKCSEQGGAHCVHFMCWTNLDGGEDGAFCVDEKKIGSCARGVYVEGDCGAEGRTCSAGACVEPLGVAVTADVVVERPPADVVRATGAPRPLPPSVADGGCAQTGAPAWLALAAACARRRRR
jgi:hypothetical protein